MKLVFYAGGWLAFLLVVAVLIGESRGEELKVYPAMTVSEIYDDNLYNDSRDRVSEFVTRIMPSLSGRYQTGRLDLELGYTLDYRYYLKGERDNEDVHFLEAKGTAALVKDKVFLEVQDEYARVSLDATRDFREESLFINQSNRNIFSASPYFDIRPTPRTSLKGGYRFVDVMYENDEGTDRQDHVFFLEGGRELTQYTTARFGGRYISQTTEDLDHKQQDVWGGVRWRYSDAFSFFGNLGYTWIDYEEGSREGNITWDIGVTRVLPWFDVTASTGVSYVEDPDDAHVFRLETHRLTLSKDWSRSRASVSGSFSEFHLTDPDVLDTRRYGGTIDINHELTPRWTILAAVSGYTFDDAIEDTETVRYILNGALSYLIATDFTGTLGYYYIDSHSPELEEDRYRTNRVILEVRKVF